MPDCSQFAFRDDTHESFEMSGIHIDDALSASSKNPVQNRVVTAEKAPVITGTASGSVATFSDGAAGMPLKALTIAINPVQSGSGDPSPDNVRPITGFTGANIYRAAAYDAGADPALAVSWESAAGTVYSGTLDVVNGILTVDKQGVLVKDLNISIGSADNGFAYSVDFSSIIKRATNTTVGDVMCSIAPAVTRNALAATSNPILGVAINNSGYLQFRFEVKTGMTESEIKTKYGSQRIVFGLKDPVTYLISPAQLETILGANAIWADTGDVSLEYCADTKLFIMSLVNP